MAREVQNSAMREHLKDWLAYRGINVNEVKEDFSLKYDSSGVTEITITLLVTDFPLRPEHPLKMSCTFHSDCGELISSEDETPQR